MTVPGGKGQTMTKAGIRYERSRQRQSNFTRYSVLDC
jgi:hypothetical protein